MAATIPGMISEPARRYRAGDTVDALGGAADVGAGGNHGGFVAAVLLGLGDGEDGVLRAFALP